MSCGAADRFYSVQAHTSARRLAFRSVDLRQYRFFLSVQVAGDRSTVGEQDKFAIIGFDRTSNIQSQ
jgi:hypothetical protein